jgi:signal transduction histidine kinase
VNWEQQFEGAAMRLSQFITGNLESILTEWETYAQEIGAAQGMDSADLRDHAKQLLETIADDLNTPQTEEERKEKSKGHGPPHRQSDGGQSAPERHASARAKAGFSIEDMISEYRALRASVLRQWEKNPDSKDEFHLDDVTCFNESIDQAVAESVARYATMVKQAQDMFLGVLGHDLRNPLGTIIMSAQFLMQNTSADSKYIKAASLIYSSGKGMRQLVNDLLDFTRTRLGQNLPVSPSRANLAEVAQQAVAQACAFHPDRRIVLEAAGDMNGCWDTARIGQVFSNLIGNAIKHGSDREPIEVKLNGQAEEVIVLVHNSGEPIPENAIGHIFEPLHRSLDKPGEHYQEIGLGLGLYITREIVLAHQGNVTVESTTEKGTTFKVRLPRNSPEAA